MKNLLTPKIYTKNGFVKENIAQGKRVLDVGCGSRKLPGAEGIDIVQNSDADTIHNLASFPWPYKNSTFDIILINHSLEHMEDIPKTFSEIHRIAKLCAHIIIQVPYFRSIDAYADPTHRHFFTSRSLDYFIEGADNAEYHYSNARFKKLGFWYGWPHASKNPLRQIIKKCMHRFPDFYDQYLSLVLPTECVTWELEVLKK